MTPSLCQTCLNMREVHTANSRFLLCELSFKVDNSFFQDTCRMDKIVHENSKRNDDEYPHDNRDIEVSRSLRLRGLRRERLRGFNFSALRGASFTTRLFRFLR